MSAAVKEAEGKERPIIFSGPMVKAILEGRKTQTRRAVAQPKRISDEWRRADTASIRCMGKPWEPERYLYAEFFKFDGDGSSFGKVVGTVTCPYGQPEDRLWVREKWYCAGEHECDGYPARYEVDAELASAVSTKWRTPIFMPRWASRITLEITNVRVERLQSISDEDAKAEGVDQAPYSPNRIWIANPENSRRYIKTFRKAWDKLNAKRGYSWESNPWCWVLEFRKL